jgi:hypothetical protein
MQVGRYTVRSSWRASSAGDRFLASAVIEVEETGTIFVHVDGEPLFAFPHCEAFFGAHSITREDLESVRVRRLARTTARSAGDLFVHTA